MRLFVELEACLVSSMSSKQKSTARGVACSGGGAPGGWSFEICVGGKRRSSIDRSGRKPHIIIVCMAETAADASCGLRVCWDASTSNDAEPTTTRITMLPAGVDVGGRTRRRILSGCPTNIISSTLFKPRPDAYLSIRLYLAILLLLLLPGGTCSYFTMASNWHQYAPSP